MALPARSSTTELPSVVPETEARAMFDQEARRITGLSGEAFLEKWEAGEYGDVDDSPEGRELSYLVMLIPFGQPNSWAGARHLRRAVPRGTVVHHYGHHIRQRNRTGKPPHADALRSRTGPTE